jgi:hypothetical protein
MAMAIGQAEYRSNRAVHMEPHPKALADRRYRRQGIHRSANGGACCSDNCDYRPTRNLELLQNSLEAIDLEATCFIHLDALERFRRKPHHRKGLGQGDVGIGTGDDDGV